MTDKVFLWAEKYLNLPAGTVTGVYFGTDEEGYLCCSSYASPGVWVTHSIPLTGKQRKLRYKDSFIGLGGESLDDIICAILGTEKP